MIEGGLKIFGIHYHHVREVRHVLLGRLAVGIGEDEPAKLLEQLVVGGSQHLIRQEKILIYRHLCDAEYQLYKRHGKTGSHAAGRTVYIYGSHGRVHHERRDRLVFLEVIGIDGRMATDDGIECEARCVACREGRKEWARRGVVDRDIAPAHPVGDPVGILVYLALGPKVDYVNDAERLELAHPPIGQLTQVRRAEELAPPDDLRIVREITAEIPEVRRPIHREHMLGHERRWAALTGKQEDRRKYCKYCPDILRPIHRYYYIIITIDYANSTRQYARIVASWVSMIGLDPAAYGTHSLRRTKATLIYRRTKNLRAVQLLLVHRQLESTVRYLGIEVDDALEMAEQTEV